MDRRKLASGILGCVVVVTWGFVFTALYDAVHPKPDNAFVVRQYAKLSVAELALSALCFAVYPRGHRIWVPVLGSAMGIFILVAITSVVWMSDATILFLQLAGLLVCGWVTLSFASVLMTAPGETPPTPAELYAVGAKEA